MLSSVASGRVFCYEVRAANTESMLQVVCVRCTRHKAELFDIFTREERGGYNVFLFGDVKGGSKRVGVDIVALGADFLC